MTRAATAITTVEDSHGAGQALGQQIRDAFAGAAPDAVIVFAAPHYDHAALLTALEQTCHPSQLVGCSSAGEFRGSELHQDSASALALIAPEMTFRAALGTGMATDRERVVSELLASFAGPRMPQFRYRTALVLADALNGYTDDLIGRLARRTAGSYQFVGGGAGDNARFQRTPVFFGREVHEDAVVALEILSNKPLGIGVSHGWTPATSPLRATEVDGVRVIGLNAAPAMEAFEEYAASVNQTFDRKNPLPFFLHHILGIATPGGYQLRVPLAVLEDGSVLCAADIPEGSLVHIMQSSQAQASDAAATAARIAVGQLNDNEPEVALFFDCVATRLRLGPGFSQELESLQTSLGGLASVGCNSHGQIAGADGQFSGFHNCTAVVCAIPR